MNRKKAPSFTDAGIFGFLLLSLSFAGCASLRRNSSSPPLRTAPSLGATSDSTVPEWTKPYFFTTLSFPIEELVSPPPAEQSAEEAADLAQLANLQKSRTKSECSAAARQEIPTLEELFARKKSGDRGLPDFKKLDAETLSGIKTLFSHVQRDVAAIGRNAKVHYDRKRPYLRNAELHPCIKREESASYPSAHSAYGSSGAELLSELFPRNATALRKAGAAAAELRVTAGVHYPSDVAAGVKLGRKVYEMLRANGKFQVELESVKALMSRGIRKRAKARFSPGTSLEKIPAGGATAI